MEAQDRSRSPSRRTSRVEQVVGRWLRRSRDLGSRSHSLSRDRVAADGKPAESSSSDQRNYPFRFNVQIQRDPSTLSHGLTLSSQTPIVVTEVTPGGPADGRLVPGDQLVKINNVAVDDLTPGQASEIIRECQDTLTMTILRIMVGPKSSFITPEKRAKLRSNPVKVHFAEEVEVNGHSQGNSLLFLPNVLKVYLENGQTKAFKFEPSTTVKDIVMTLKEKLSLGRIEHFSLVLEQQHSISKLLLLHEEERIQQVVQKKEAHDYRCLFRVCFMPRSLEMLLQDDPTAFEYLYLQGVNDVLQERFAVEMRCNTALRLAALHIQERLASCGQSPKTNLKMITKTWGIENFVSSTLLRNMREKDLRKAIGYHMKKSQAQHDPKQKGVSVDQARINYLDELSDLKSFGGKSFGATMMLQDRESMVTLLVGARYGVSQVVNHKLSILSTLTEFSCITRIELLPESDKVSLVKIYLQDIKPITLLLESAAAKDMSCLIAGYCRVFVDPRLNIFPWMDDSRKHKVSAEEGYVSRCGSDSDDSSDPGMEPPAGLTSRDEKPCPRVRSSSDPDGRKRKDRQRKRESKGASGRSWDDKKVKEEKDGSSEKEKTAAEKSRDEDQGQTDETQDGGQRETTQSASGGQAGGQAGGGPEGRTGGQVGGQTAEQTEGHVGGHVVGQTGGQTVGGSEVRVLEDHQSASEASDSCHTDSRVLTSPSSDSLDALEEDDLLSCSSSSVLLNVSSLTQVHSSLQLHPFPERHAQPHLLTPPPAHSHPLLHLGGGGSCRRSGDGGDQHLLTPDSSHQNCAGGLCSDDSSLCFAELSRMVDFLPSPPEASEEEDEEDELRRRRKRSMLQEVELAARRAGSLSVEGGSKERRLSPSPSSPSSHLDFVFNFDQSDARCYYNICSNITPDSARSLSHPPQSADGGEGEGEGTRDQAVPILQPPPGFGDSSSDEEFFDARDGFTSPEDPTSGAVPRDVCTEMKLNFLSTVSLSDIQLSVPDTDRDGKAQEGEDETLLQMRKRSRKRRSYMETDYTSRVSYPDPDPKSQQAPVSTRLPKALLAETGDAQMCSADPEPSKQTQNPSPTVSSLTHSEGEPSQLESKPILSKLSSYRSDSLSSPRSHEPKDSQVSPRTKKQDMEMEPDAMESKSVTDLLKATSPAITVVRCRVDPDGKESADRRADGKEEGVREEAMEEGERDEAVSVTGNGPFTSHMFLPEKNEVKDIEENKKRTPSTDANTKTPEVSMKGSNGLLVSQLNSPEMNTHIDEFILEEQLEKSNMVSYSPPPPPPSSPLPLLLAPPESRTGRLVEDKGVSQNPQTRTSDSEEHPEASPTNMGNHTNKAQSLETSENDDKTLSGSSATPSDDVTDSTNSDNVFDDDADEVTDSVDLSLSENKDETHTAAKHGVSKSNSQTSIKSLLSTEPQRLPSIDSDYTRAINSITAKLGAATSVTSPTFNSGSQLKSDFDLQKVSTQHEDIPKRDSTSSNSEMKESLASPRLAKRNTSTVQDLCKEPLSPTHFLFQTCSPSIMGRLSASTLRGKIQKLPLYLSRSQETVNQAGVENVEQTPSEDKCRETSKITIQVTDIHDVTQTVDLEKGAAVESVESDDSDTTITGSEVDTEYFVEANSAKSFHPVSEVGRVCPQVPIQTEPKAQCHQATLYSGLVKSTPGPITEPPTSIASHFQTEPVGFKTDTPGPVKDAPEPNVKVEDSQGNRTSSQSPSIPAPIVVTTQNLNGPGLPFHSQPQKARRISSDRPLMGLCRPSEQNSNSPKALSSGCRVFTICEDPSQNQPPGEVVSAPPFKAEISCGSVLASGCESVVEGIQVPLDACGCPAVYSNCFSSGDGFDDELTVYEFSCRTQSSGMTQTSGAGLPLMSSAPVPSFLSTSSSTYSPSFPRSILFSSSTSELSPLLSPLSDSLDSHRDTISRLGQQRYPEPPAGFQVLRVDVDQLLSVLESSSVDRSVAGYGGRHPRDTCPAHFTENKRVLQLEARRLMSGCQKVVGIGQSPQEMLRSLADSFRTLVELAGICLWFSGCDRCDRRNAEAVAGLADVARSFRDFCLAAERASSKRSCQDLSTKLLAKQCTALTASVFCLTQLFRTLTAL